MEIGPDIFQKTSQSLEFRLVHVISLNKNNEKKIWKPLILMNFNYFNYLFKFADKKKKKFNA